ncbi:hypothetical protein NDU88_001542 [Pleurodeles waltl]|uniref:Secreted protein n=1 Tax=Pleurodeles waltl TaxID=8319 RepID=A0AAV7VWR9_PLEWA|nr:hypothetical protein NDU88_001542 [Pleurodeles waltl]
MHKLELLLILLQTQTSLQLLACFCGPCTALERVPSIKSLRRMDAKAMQNVLKTCASCSSDNTIHSFVL